MLAQIHNSATNAGALQPVHMEDVRTAGGRDVIGSKAVMLGGKPICIVSSKYKMLKNSDMLARVSDSVERSGLDITGLRVTTSFDDTRTLVDIDFPAHKFEISSNDIVDFRITAQNSYNGEWRFGLIGGAFRLACSNGMTIGTSVSAYNTKHTKRLSIDDMATRISALYDIYMGKTVEWQQMARKPIGGMVAHQQILKYIGKPATTPLESLPTRSEYHKLHALWVRYSTELGSTYWALLNAFTHYSTHGHKPDNVVSLPLRVRREMRTARVSGSWKIAA